MNEDDPLVELEEQECHSLSFDLVMKFGLAHDDR